MRKALHEQTFLVQTKKKMCPALPAAKKFRCSNTQICSPTASHPVVNCRLFRLSGPHVVLVKALLSGNDTGQSNRCVFKAKKKKINVVILRQETVQQTRACCGCAEDLCSSSKATGVCFKQLAAMLFYNCALFLSGYI